VILVRANGSGCDAHPGMAFLGVPPTWYVPAQGQSTPTPVPTITPTWLPTKIATAKTLNILTVFCQYTPDPVNPLPTPPVPYSVPYLVSLELAKTVFPSVVDFWSAQSQGKITLNMATFHSSWLTMDYTSYEDSLEYPLVATDCLTQAIQDGVDLNPFVRSNNGIVILFFDYFLWNRAAAFTPLSGGMPTIYINGSFYTIDPIFVGNVQSVINIPSLQATIAHEIGHILGLLHSYSPYYLPGDVYGSAWDVMSNAAGTHLIYPTLNPVPPLATPTAAFLVSCGQWQTVDQVCIPINAIPIHRYYAGWVQPAEVETISAPTTKTIRLKVLDSSPIDTNQNERYMIRIDLPTRTEDADFYTVEARMNRPDQASYDNGLPIDRPVVLIHRVKEPDYESPIAQVGRPVILDIDKRTLNAEGYKVGYICNHSKDERGNANDSGSVFFTGEDFIDEKQAIRVKVVEFYPETEMFEIEVSVGQPVPPPLPGVCP